MWWQVGGGEIHVTSLGCLLVGGEVTCGDKVTVVEMTVHHTYTHMYTGRTYIEAIDRIFYWFTGVIDPRGMLGEHEKSL